VQFSAVTLTVSDGALKASLEEQEQLITFVLERKRLMCSKRRLKMVQVAILTKKYGENT